MAHPLAPLPRVPRYHRGGLYARDLPFIAGQEGGGKIAAVSPKAAAEGFKVGDRVALRESSTESWVVQEVRKVRDDDAFNYVVAMGGVNPAAERVNGGYTLMHAASLQMFIVNN